MEKTFETLKSKQRYKQLLLRFISVVSIAYFLYYLWWRAAYTLNPQALAFSWVLLLAEAFGVVSFILFSWMTQDVSPRYPYKTPRAGVRVDVFIPTYNEGIDILEATLTGCRCITYPHQTYVLDDGDRAEVRELAQRMDCRYIARPVHDHAKAGNINYALTKTDGEFIVLLDADMVPQPGYIDRTLGYFENEKLAYIQMPQEFYNQDSIQHKSGDWHEQSLFFRVIQPGKNYSNSAFWCGSPSIVRRSALEQVGGVATETITEDIHTSVRMHSRGWHSLFLKETLAYGIAPQTIQSFLVQRLRWAQGTMQLYRSKESPLWIRGLTLRQRLSYLSSFLAYFESFQKLVLILTPVFILLFNIYPMRVNMMVFLFHWVPYFGFNILANQLGGRGHFRYFQTEKYNILKMMVFIQSTMTLVFHKNLKFKVTPKSVDNSVYRNERRSMRAYMAILGLITGVIIFGLIRLVSWQRGITQKETLLVTLVWAVYNAIVILIGIWEVLGKPHERKQYRFPVNLEAEIIERGTMKRLATVRLRDISLTGAGLVLNELLPFSNRALFLLIVVPAHGQLLLPIKNINYQRRSVTSWVYMGISFDIISGINRQQLFEYLFVDLATSQQPEGIRALNPKLLPRLLDLVPRFGMKEVGKVADFLERLHFRGQSIE